jgi:hypothetical protein
MEMNNRTIRALRDHVETEFGKIVARSGGLDGADVEEFLEEMAGIRTGRWFCSNARRVPVGPADRRPRRRQVPSMSPHFGRRAS